MSETNGPKATELARRAYEASLPPARRELEQSLDGFRALLATNKIQRAITAALPAHLGFPHFARVVLTELGSKPKLLEMDRRQSLLAAILTGAQYGLEIGGPLAQGWLVPFGKDLVQFIPGYQGFLQLMRNSGEIAAVDADVARYGETLDWRRGTDPHLDYRSSSDPSIADADVEWIWMVVHFKDPDSKPFVRVKPKWWGLRVRDRFAKSWQRFAIVSHFRELAAWERAGKEGDPPPRPTCWEFVEGTRELGWWEKDGRRGQIVDPPPWATDLEPMLIKTLIRESSKYLPRSVQRLAAIDAAAERGDHAEMDEAGGLIIDAVATTETEAEPERGEAGNGAPGAPSGAQGSEPPPPPAPDLDGFAAAHGGGERPQRSDLAPMGVERARKIRSALQGVQGKGPAWLTKRLGQSSQEIDTWPEELFETALHEIQKAGDAESTPVEEAIKDPAAGSSPQEGELPLGRPKR